MTGMPESAGSACRAHVVTLHKIYLIDLISIDDEISRARRPRPPRTFARAFYETGEHLCLQSHQEKNQSVIER